MTDSRKGGRPRKGSLEFRGKTWHARLTITVEGESIRKWFDLGTDNKAVARRKRDRLVAELAVNGAPPTQISGKSPETVDDYAKGWIQSRRERGIVSVAYEAVYYARIWSPAFGRLQLGAVKAAPIRAVLNDVAAGKILPKARADRKRAPKPYGRQSISHIRATAFRLFDAAWRDELIPENPVARVRVPDMNETSKARAVLTDSEIAALVSHPDADAEMKVLVLLSRTIGGLRAGDLNGMDWTAFSPGFATCSFVRRKTRRKNPLPQTLEVPQAVRPFVHVWWERQGCPVAGPVFPVRKGKRAGGFKKHSSMSYADRLRRELLRAWVTRHELHHETATTLPVDFHSTRRAYATALARVGVNDQTAMVLTGHSDPKVHQRYVEQASIRALPAAAVPSLDPNVAQFVANRFRPKLGTKPHRPEPSPVVFSLASQPEKARVTALRGTSSVGRARASQA